MRLGTHLQLTNLQYHNHSLYRFFLLIIIYKKLNYKVPEESNRIGRTVDFSFCQDRLVNSMEEIIAPIGATVQSLVTTILNLVFIIDATGSMATTLEALKPALSQLLQLFPLFAPSAKFHLAIYRDFDQPLEKVYTYHGPFSANDINKMIDIIAATKADGGGDSDEAQKYAFGQFLREGLVGQTIMYHFTDASPHSFPFPANGAGEHGKEGTRLKLDALDQDWIPLCHKFNSIPVHAIQNIPVYTIGQLSVATRTFYAVLAEISQGDLVLLNNTSVDTILRTTVKIVTRSLGFDECDLTGLASIGRVQDATKIPKSEASADFRNLLIQVEAFSADGQCPFAIRQAADICTRKNLEQRYKVDPDFQLLCFQTFISMLKAGHIMALTYNPLLGCLYRLMNRRSKIAKTEALREELNLLVSQKVSDLKKTNPQAFEQVSKWIEESYGRIEEINELFISVPELFPILVLQVAGIRMTKKELTLACKIPMPHNLRRLAELVSGIFLVNSRPKTMPEVFVPLSISNADLFALLSHLMCPGVKLDFRPSAVMALVTLSTGNAILAGRALDFLRESQGKWFDKTGSEWHLFGIIKLLLRLDREHGGILTSEEVEYMQPLFNISAIKYNNSELECERKFKLQIEHGKDYPDHKAKCGKCNQFRSLSVMTPECCGLCLSYQDPSLLASALADESAKKSCLFECSRCDSRYAVRNVAGLNTKPKCHFCRQTPPMSIADIPKVTCVVCDVGMILPDGANKVSDKFMCAICVENGGEERLEKLPIRLHELLLQNRNFIPGLLGLDIDPVLLCNRDSLMSLCGKFKCVNAVPLPDTSMYFEGRPLLNTPAILATIRDIIATGSVGTETCLICYGDFIHIELESLCHIKGCKAQACRPCIKSWFSENKPGQRVLETRLTCPSCKRVPQGGLAFLDPTFKALSLQKLTFDHDWHYAWCKSCGNVKEYMERQCAGPDPMEITNFECEDCQKPGEHKACPFCGVPTVKAAGCDHMICPKEAGGCGVHWCYRCDGPNVFHADNSHDVYSHLHDVHGNIWGAPANE